MRKAKKTSLFLLVVAVVVNCGYGNEDLPPVCTNNKDCNYEHGLCFKYDQCELGWCYCDVGHIYSTTDNPKCSLVSWTEYGQECSADEECGTDLSCVSNICGCSSDTKHSIYDYFGNAIDICYAKNAEVVLEANDTCSANVAAMKQCVPGHTCWRCPERNPNETTICLSPPAQLATTTTATTTRHTTSPIQTSLNDEVETSTNKHVNSNPLSRMSGADHVAMIPSVIGCLAVSAILAVAFY